jgi:anti-sigma factor RsiW
MKAYHCDPETLVESYVMGRLSQSDRESFEAHLKRCVTCARQVGQEREFVNAMLAACRQLALRSSGDVRKTKTAASGSH